MARRELQSRREKEAARAAREAKRAGQNPTFRRAEPWVPPTPQHRPPARRVVVGIVAVIALVVLLFAAVRENGPALEVKDVEAATVSIYRGPLPDGHTFGGPVVHNRSGEPVVIEKVQILWKGPQRRYLGAYVLDGRRPRDLAEDDRWPPRDARRSYSHKIPGAQIDPGETVQLVLGVGFRGRASTWFDAIRVRYRIGGIGHIQDLPMRIWHCPTLSHDACTREQAEHEKRNG